MVFTRRNFMCGASAVTLSTPAFMRALATNASAAGSGILVVCELNGGNDSFNMVIPWDTTNYGIYQSNRANIAISQSAILNAESFFDPTPSPVGQGTTYAFNPTMAPASAGATNNLRALYGTGKVALIMGVGLPPNAISRDGHQQAQFYWQTSGVNNLGTTNIGWVGQAIDQIGSNGSLPGAIALDGSAQIALYGNKTSPLVVGSALDNFSPNYGNAGGTAGPKALQGNNAYATSAMPSELTRTLGAQTTGFVANVQAVAKAEPLSDYSTNYPTGSNKGSGLKSQFKQVARLIMGGAPTRTYYVRQGGYDTHVSQNAGQPGLLGEFSEAVTEFNQYLAAHNASSNVVVMTISDFGRRPYSNSSAGTDHGTATMHYLIGDQVAGGTYFVPGAQGVTSTGYPNLNKSGLDSNGNVYVSIDFRYQISAALQWLGADPTPIVGSSYVATSGANANLNKILPGLQ